MGIGIGIGKSISKGIGIGVGIGIGIGVRLRIGVCLNVVYICTCICICICRCLGLCLARDLLCQVLPRGVSFETGLLLPNNKKAQATPKKTSHSLHRGGSKADAAETLNNTDTSLQESATRRNGQSSVAAAGSIWTTKRHMVETVLSLGTPPIMKLHVLGKSHGIKS